MFSFKRTSMAVIQLSSIYDIDNPSTDKTNQENASFSRNTSSLLITETGAGQRARNQLHHKLYCHTCFHINNRSWSHKTILVKTKRNLTAHTCCSSSLDQATIILLLLEGTMGSPSKQLGWSVGYFHIQSLCSLHICSGQRHTPLPTLTSVCSCLNTH